MPPDDLKTLAAGMAQLQSGARGDGGLTNAAGSFATAATLEVLRRANTVWDYSASNVPSLAALGISATHVPLGDAPPWRIRPALAAAVSANASSSIPVLFYGTLTRHRAATLAAIRAGPNGQPVVHANAATDGTFGAALDAQIAAADVVLNLRAFGDRDDEWKTRGGNARRMGRVLEVAGRDVPRNDVARALRHCVAVFTSGLGLCARDLVLAAGADAAGLPKCEAAEPRTADALLGYLAVDYCC